MLFRQLIFPMDILYITYSKYFAGTRDQIDYIVVLRYDVVMDILLNPRNISSQRADYKD